MEITDGKAAELSYLLHLGAKMTRDLIRLRRLDASAGERLALDFEEALAALMPPAHRWPQDKPGRNYKAQPLAGRLLALMLHHPRLCTDLADALQPLREDSGPRRSSLDLVFKVFDLIQKNPDYTFNHVLSYWHQVHGQDERNLLARIAANELLLASETAAVDPLAEAREIIARLTDYEDAVGDMTAPPARPAKTLADCLDLAISIVERPKTKDVIPCKCTAYLHTHFLGEGDCCGCETSPDCEHWTRVPDYYGTGDRDNVRYERVEK